MEYNVAMIERMLPFIDFRNIFISILLNTLDIESEEDSNIDESKEFNADI